VTPGELVVAGIGKRFGPVTALADFSLSLAPGQVGAVLGPSGCGKTTALRIVAGFERPDAGTVAVGGRPVASPTVHVPPERRGVGMVFQDFALFPHLTVAENVAFGLARADRSRLGGLLELVGISHLAGRRPGELSGGEQQRVALARSLAPGPGVVLLDEPFSNLDASLRDAVRRQVLDVVRRLGTTVLLVTHDQGEALASADVLAVMRDGRVGQSGRPDDVYAYPADAWVGSSLGEGSVLSTVADGAVAPLPFGTVATDLRGPVTVLVRPEDVALTAGGPFPVVLRELRGPDQVVEVAAPDGTRLRARLPSSPPFARGERVGVGIRRALVYPVPGDAGS